MRATMIQTSEGKPEGKQLRGARASIALVLLVAAAIGCSSGASDDAAKFAGPWTFASGELAATCTLITPPAPFPLAGLGVEIVKVNSGAFDLLAGSTGKCKVRFNVAGSKATAVTSPAQSCVLEVGSFGEQTLGVKSWTLELDGDRLKSTTSGSVLVCNLSGSGVLVRGAPDGGVRPTDGGGDATDAPRPDAGTDVAASDASDAAPDAPSDTASDAGSDASDASDATGG